MAHRLISPKVYIIIDVIDADFCGNVSSIALELNGVGMQWNGKHKGWMWSCLQFFKIFFICINDIFYHHTFRITVLTNIA